MFGDWDGVRGFNITVSRLAPALAAVIQICSRTKWFGGIKKID